MCIYACCRHILTMLHTSQMNKIISATRSNDCTRLRREIGTYAAPDPTVAAVSPLIHGSNATQLGLNHPVLARMICPIEAVMEYETDVTE